MSIVVEGALLLILAGIAAIVVALGIKLFKGASIRTRASELLTQLATGDATRPRAPGQSSAAFTLADLEGVQVGDKVYFHVTNLEQDWDVPHGFAIMGAQTAELLIMPGQTETSVWEPRTEGVFPMYCTDFCSALHQEMQGYVRVSAKGSNVPLKWWTGSKSE